MATNQRITTVAVNHLYQGLRGMHSDVCMMSSLGLVLISVLLYLCYNRSTLEISDSV